MGRVNLFVIVFLVVGVLLGGCGSTNEKELSTEEGYVLDKDDGKLSVAKDISAEEFSEIVDGFDPNDLSNFESDDVGLIYISYDDLSNIEKGDKIKAWVEGVADSYPQQAKAEKIEKQN